MRHFPTITGSRTFRQFVEITMDHCKERGFGADVEVEVEFTARPSMQDKDSGIWSDEDREITGIRKTRYEITNGKMTFAGYHEIPDWLLEAFKACINVDDLDADWSDDL